MAAVLAIQLALAGAIQLAAERLAWPATLAILIALAYAIGAILNHYGGVIIHEASHDLCAPTKTQNRWIAIFANLPKVLPYAMTFRRHHMSHHIAMGVIGKDNDLPKDFERRIVGNVRWRKLLWVIGYPLAGALLRSFLRWPSRWEVVGAAVQMAFNAGIAIVIGPWALGYLALSTFFSASLHPIAGHFIHEHYLWDEAQETYSYYGVLNRVTLNMGYHVEHHDFPQVPGKSLPRLHAIAREYYDELTSHTSWTEVFRIFVTDPRLSHHSRFVRDASAMRADVKTLRWPSSTRDARS
jgi:sphingolipid delta-4 desaturase